MTFAQLLETFQSQRALVAGDLMLDQYIFGRATRISPEAPVMVVRQERTTAVPGGAANVAHNLAALGAAVDVIGAIGDDEAGAQLRDAIRTQGVGVRGVLAYPEIETTRKTRVVADHAHQVLRIDAESTTPIAKHVEDALARAAEELMDGVSLLLFSDYLKGTLTQGLVSRLMQSAQDRSLPVAVNPKPRSAMQYRGASLMTMNRQELSELVGTPQPLDDEQVPAAADHARESCGVRAFVATLGAAGMFVTHGSTREWVPAPRVEVYDTAGAGDTVIACAALGLACAGLRPEIFELAAQLAARVVQKVGVAVPSAADLDSVRNWRSEPKGVS